MQVGFLLWVFGCTERGGGEVVENIEGRPRALKH